MVVLSIVIIAFETATHERTLIHVDCGLFCHMYYAREQVIEFLGARV